MNGKTEVLRQLLKLRPGLANDVGRKSCATPLYSAALNGDRSYDCIELLLRSGADPNLPMSRDGTKSTPLHAAAVAGHANIIPLLVSYGADLEANGDGTPLSCAAEYGHAACVEALLRAGAKPSSTDEVRPLYVPQTGIPISRPFALDLVRAASSRCRKLSIDTVAPSQSFRVTDIASD